MLESKQISAYDDPSKAFIGVRFVLFGFDSVKEDKARSKLLEGGGVDAVNYGPDCNYVIVDKLVYDDPICAAARRDGKTLVTGLWVDHSFDLGMPVDPASVMYRPMRDLNGIPGAKALVVCLTGYQRQDRDDIMTMVALMGANFSKPLVANKVTHLICYKFEGEKYELAKKMKRIKVVNHRWLEDCLKAWELLTEADYSKSGYELEMEAAAEAEAKDSEEETEDMTLTVRKNVVSPQITRVEDRGFHHSPVKQEISRNNSYLGVCNSLPTVGDNSKTLSTPGKEINNERTSFSPVSHDKQFYKSRSRSANTPEKMSSGLPLGMLDRMVSEKVDNVLAPASEGAKKSPVADVSKLSTESCNSPTSGAGKKSPVTDLSKLSTSYSPTSEAGRKSPVADGSELSTKRYYSPTSGAGKDSPIADVPKLSTESYYKSTPRTTSLRLRPERIEGNSVCSSALKATNKHVLSGGFDMPMGKYQDGKDDDMVKTPLKATLSHFEGQTVSPNKRRSIVSRGSSKSPISSRDREILMKNELVVKTAEIPAYGSSVDGSHGLVNNTSTTTVGEKVPLILEEALNISVASEGRQVCNNDQALQRSREGLGIRNASNLDVKEISGEVEIHPNDLRSVEPSSGRTNPGEEKIIDGQDELSFSKAGNNGSHKKPRKQNLLARKTLGSRPTILKGRTTKKGSLNLQQTALQSNGDIIDSATITENVVIVPPTSAEDRPVNDEPKPSKDNGQNEFNDKGSDNEESVEIEAITCSGKGAVFTKKRVGAKIMQMKDQLLKSVGGKNAVEAEMAVCSKTIELEKSKSAGDHVEEKKKRTSKGKKGIESEKAAASKNGIEAEKVVCSKTIELEKSKPTGDHVEEKKKKTSKGKKGIESERAASGKKAKLDESKSTTDAGERKSTKGKNKTEADKAASGKKTKLNESESTGDGGEKKITNGRKRPLAKSRTNQLKDPNEELQEDISDSRHDENKNVSVNEETVALAGKTKTRPSKKLKRSANVEKENKPTTSGQQNVKSDDTVKGDSQPVKKTVKNVGKSGQANSKGILSLEVKSEPSCFILSGHRLQRKEFKQVIKRLKGKVCRDSHQWSYQATHFIVPDPVKRTEKFFAAAASGSWILKTDYLAASNEAGKFISEEPYEWHKKCLTEDGAINLEAPRKWRLQRERTGHGAFYGTRIIIYGECIAPPLDTLKRVVKAGDGNIVATSPPYTRFLKEGVDFAIVSPGMPRVDMWVQEFVRHEVPCVVADYLVEYVCKPGYPLERHVQYNTHAWAKKSFENMVNREEEDEEEDPRTPQDHRMDDVSCGVCGSRDRGEEMLICGDEDGSRGCGAGVHIDCLDPPLEGVPEEDWFCAKCSGRSEGKTGCQRSKKRASKSKK